MTKKQRFMELVRIILTQQMVRGDDFLTTCDCFISMPDRCIPDSRSMRFFASDVIDFFLGRSDRCELNYKRAASYIGKWQAAFVNDHQRRFGSVPPGHPAIVWVCDPELRVQFINGPVLELLRLRPEDFLGQRLTDFWGTSDADHPIVGPSLKALKGEMTTARMLFGGHAFELVVVPKLRDGRVTGVNGTAVLLPQGALSREVTPQVQPEPGDGAPIVLKTDRNLRVVSASGSALKPSPNDFVGLDVAELLGAGEAHLVDQFKQSLDGHVISRRATFRGRQWQIITSPRAESGGVLGMGVLLNGDPDPAPAVMEIRSASLVPIGRPSRN